MPIDDPFDHNAECRFCDEQAMHRVDCPWLLQLVARVEELEAERFPYSLEALALARIYERLPPEDQQLLLAFARRLAELQGEVPIGERADDQTEVIPLPKEPTRG